MSISKMNYMKNYRNLDMFNSLQQELILNCKKIIFPDGHISYYSKFLFSNVQFIEWYNSVGNEIRDNNGSFYVYNKYNYNLPIEEHNNIYFCPTKYKNHPLCGVNWLTAKTIVNSFGGRLPQKDEMDYLTSFVKSDIKVNTDEILGQTNCVDYFEHDEFGLYDISGNVSEWCEEYNPKYPEEKLVYGVSWNNSHGNDKMFCRYKWSQLGAVSVGFRVVWDELPNFKKNDYDLIDIIPRAVKDENIECGVECINIDRQVLEKGIKENWVENYTRSFRYFLAYHIMKLSLQDNVIDIGSGDDGFAYLIQDKVNKVYVNDINICKVYGSNCTTLECNIFDVDIKKYNINKIFLGHAFEHFGADLDVELIKKIACELPQGGMCCIEPLFLGEVYVEVFGEDSPINMYDREAEQIITSTSKFPGKCGENMGFARIYNMASLKKRILNVAEKLGLSFEIYSFKCDSQYLPDMKKYKFKRKNVNYPYRILVLRKE